jgi:hypothetical protein
MTARRPRLWAFFALFALVGFVVAQPTLDALGKAPDFFLFRHAGRAEILILVLAVTVLPALALWLAELAAGPGWSPSAWPGGCSAGWRTPPGRA